MTLTDRINNINKHLEIEVNAQQRENLRDLRQKLINQRLNEEATLESKEVKLRELWELSILMEKKGRLDIAKKLRGVRKRMSGAI